jgi:hypothetical protein
MIREPINSCKKEVQMCNQQTQVSIYALTRAVNGAGVEKWVSPFGF